MAAMSQATTIIRLKCFKILDSTSQETGIAMSTKLCVQTALPPTDWPKAVRPRADERLDKIIPEVIGWKSIPVQQSVLDLGFVHFINSSDHQPSQLNRRDGEVSGLTSVWLHTSIVEEHSYFV